MSELPKQILVIDDDSTVAQAIEGPLSQYGVAVFGSQDVETARYMFSNQEFDVVLVSLAFRALNGLVLIQKLRDHDVPEKRATAFIVTSGKVRSPSDDALMREMLDIEILLKPFTLVQILPYLSRGLANKSRLLKFEKYRLSALERIGKGEAQAVIDEIQKNLKVLGSKGVVLLMDCYIKANRAKDALAIISPLTAKDPNNALYQYQHGRILRILGMNEEAREHLEIAFKHSPQHIGRLNEMAGLYLDLKQPDMALGKFKDLLKNTPENQDVKFQMFRMLQERGFNNEALSFCQETTKPQEVVRYYNNLGVQLSKQGDTKGALREYERALKFFPKFKENFRIYFNIALAYTKLKEPDSPAKAVHNLERCLELDPTFDKAKTMLAQLKLPKAS